MLNLQAKWDAIYAQSSNFQPTPAIILAENAFLLPQQGCALDLASGLGGNALFLAERGLAVSAWDISAVALKQLDATARARNLPIHTQHQAIDSKSFGKDCFDVIVVSRFLDRSLTNAIIAALKKDGLLFYQTFTQVKATPDGPNNNAYLLAPLELLLMFAELQVIYYRDNALIGDLQLGLRNEAQYIGRKK